MRGVVDTCAEQTLVREARAGDQEAFAALVHQYWGRIHRWLYGLNRNVHEAEDLTQEAFLRAWATLPDLENEAAFRPWLFRIAQNALIDCRRSPRPVASLAVCESARAREPGPLLSALHREGEGLLEQACAGLPELYRAPFLLWTQEELAYNEIAAALGISEETARWRVCKARHLLLKDLEGYLDRKS
jgi:RNA polymerase sigma-70 factor (ECF subfamily)